MSTEDNIQNTDNTDNTEKFVCEFCKKEYKTKYTLSSHIKTNKKCQKSRGDTSSDDKKAEKKDVSTNVISNISNAENETYRCTSCDYYTMLKTDLQRHTVTCVKYQIDDKIKEKNAEISKLQWEADLANAKVADRDRKINEVMAANSKLVERVKMLTYYMQLIAEADDGCSCGKCNVGCKNKNDNNNE